MRDQLTGKVIVITGASAGVGRATARAFARRGSRIGLMARGREGLVCPVDVADAEQVERAAAAIEGRFGEIDIWVNCAMVTVFAPVAVLTAAEIQRVTDVTYMGVVHGTLAALRRMLPRDRGVIVQVGSALALRSIPLQSAYCGAKHAIHGFTESLRCELLHEESKVHVTEVQLPGLNTPQFEWGRSHMPKKAQPVPPIYEPEVAADAIVWAATHRQREVYVGGMTGPMVWGEKLAPELIDVYLAKTNYQAQQREEGDSPDRPDNLFSPVSGDFGARGPFADRAHERSAQWELSKRRGVVAAVLLAGAVLVGLLGLVG